MKDYVLECHKYHDIINNMSCEQARKLKLRFEPKVSYDPSYSNVIIKQDYDKDICFKYFSRHGMISIESKKKGIFEKNDDFLTTERRKIFFHYFKMMIRNLLLDPHYSI